MEKSVFFYNVPLKVKKILKNKMARKKFLTAVFEIDLCAIILIGTKKCRENRGFCSPARAKLILALETGAKKYNKFKN